MSRESEQVLEDKLVAQLSKLGYSIVEIKNTKELEYNLKNQIEKHNKITLSISEFDRVLNILKKGNVFEKAQTLREKQHILRDNGENLYFEFINIDNWCQNEFQVTRQVSQEGTYSNRYDVTLLINGLPLVHIELKRKGLELKEAFNQINRYQRHTFFTGNALFQYVQIFVISNGVNTKYYANNRKQSFKQTYYWTDTNNKRLSNIENGFTDAFLEPCHISKMICKYVVLNQANKILMVLRPYQYYAVESLIERVKNTDKNGYIWHTTGSGKTLTSFKASQIIMNIDKVHKVVFVVDRKDLDYQTQREFDSFKKGCVDVTENTKSLVKQFTDPTTKLIVTTIQKLNTAITKIRYESTMSELQDKKIIFIFDECHRSQFGDTHKRIKTYFRNIQMFGFTGTPIFTENALKNESGLRTTKDLFDDCLHKYVITDAIKDENVLKFSVEYVGRYKNKDGSENQIDIDVEDIDTKELMEDEKRLEKIVDYIIANHNHKTHSREFTAMFCISNVNVLTKYYDLFKKKKSEGKHNLNIATIFSYSTNEEDIEANGFIADELSTNNDFDALNNLPKQSREKLDSYIEDFNVMFGTKYSTKSNEDFYNYYNEVSRKVKNKQVDLLLVVNMFLTGFDSPSLNTMYVDKNLQYHGLIQAYSRTNRILDEKKSQGNIVVFRNLKNKTDEAITLFSDKEAVDVIIMQPYEYYVKIFDTKLEKLIEIAPNIDSINDFITEEEELEFVQAFRELIRVKNVLNSFADFKWEDLQMTEQDFENYKSKYLDLWHKVKTDTQKEKVSILEDVDFELELIHQDDINVTYIIKKLIELKLTPGTGGGDGKIRAEILQSLQSHVTLRSKKELIENFIINNLPVILDSEDIEEEFNNYIKKEREKEFQKIISEENLNPEKTQRLIENYLFAEREPLNDEILDLLTTGKPNILQRRPLGERILKRLNIYIETFINGIS